MTTTPDNPFAAAEVGALYARGRPYHHPRSLARLRALLAQSQAPADARADVDADVDADVERALDVACGTGMSTVALADFAGVVAGVDISPEMMRVAPAAPNVTYMLGRAERLPFVDSAFDAVTCSSGIHWFDQEPFYEELRRVVRPGGWIGLYDHYFMRMPGVHGFRAWVGELFRRYPLPPRNPQVGDPRAETPAGFELLGSELFEDPIEMTPDVFADYQLTVSHCVAAAERGTPRSEIRDWLLASTAPLFGDNSTRVLQFLGTITCLRRLP
ncbi:MAG TPA: class I SAM-dependent methyltransferase [Acidimicrobiia bacterium]